MIKKTDAIADTTESQGQPSLTDKSSEKEGSLASNNNDINLLKESHPIKRESRTLCENNSLRLPSSEKEYTLSENQQVMLDGGQKVTLSIAFRHISAQAS